MTDSQPIPGSKADMAQRQRRTDAAALYDPSIPLPSAADMERCVLSCMMQAPDYAVAPAMQTLTAESFAIEAHGIIFDLLVRQHESGKPIDSPSVTRLLYDLNLVEKMGGPAIVSEIYAAAPNPAHVQHYADEVRVKGVARRVITEAWRMADAVLREPTFENVEARSMALVDDLLLATRSGDAAKIVHISVPLAEGLEELEEAFKKRGHVLGDICTGYTDLDRALIKGLPRGTVHTIAGDTGAGKTALAVGILLNMALARGHYKEFYNWDSSYNDRITDWKAALAEGRGTPRHAKLKVLMVCLESSQTEMALQMLMGEAEVDVHNLYGGFMDRTVLPRLGAAAKGINDTQIYLWDAPGITVEELAAEVKHFKMRHPDLAVVCVDHIGLLSTHAVKDKGNETAIAGWVSNALLRLYQSANVVGINLVQLNRESAEAGSKGKRPTRAMLRGSGKIEQDSYTILMPYRPGHYDPEADKEEAHIVIAKARGCAVNLNGVRCLWHGGTKRFLSAFKFTEELHEKLKEENFDLASDLYNKWSYGDIVPRDRLFSVTESKQQVRD